MVDFDRRAAADHRLTVDDPTNSQRSERLGAIEPGVKRENDERRATESAGGQCFAGAGQGYRLNA